MDTLYAKVLSISEKSGISVKRVLDTLYTLKDGKAIENNALIRFVGITKNAINQIKSEGRMFFAKTSTHTQVQKNQVRSITNLFTDTYQKEDNLFDFLKDSTYEKYLEVIKNAHKLRSKPKRQYDQFFAEEETTVKRARLMDFLGDIKGKNLLFLGDDDITSVACGLSREAARITVLDVDKEILETVNELSRREKLRIETYEYDTRKPLPSEFVGKYDIVFTDPPYTPRGFSVFLSRAISALDIKNQTSRIYVCYGVSDHSKERFSPIYEILTKSNIIMRYVFDKFNRYWGAESLGSTSTLFVCEVTPHTKVFASDKNDKHFYTTS